MATLRAYRWGAADQLWTVAARYLAESGYETVSGFVEAIRQSNPQVLDWSAGAIAAGIVVILPHLDV